MTRSSTRVVVRCPRGHLLAYVGEMAAGVYLVVPRGRKVDASYAAEHREQVWTAPGDGRTRAMRAQPDGRVQHVSCRCGVFTLDAPALRAAAHADRYASRPRTVVQQPES